MMEQQTYEGPWEIIKLHDQELIGHDVRIVVLNPTSPENKLPSRMLTFGMFPQVRDLTEEDFKIAEWRGEDLDI